MIVIPIYAAFAILIALITFAFGFMERRRFLVRWPASEALVAQTIRSGMSATHALLNNVTLKTGNGTAQIDHILVAGTGIFVIETKHYAGWIFGDPKQSHWTQTFFKKKFRFQNPIRQNYGHVKALQALFTLPESNFISLVVFTGRAQFKTDLGPSVLKLPQLIDFLSRNRPVLFNETKMTYIVGRIEMNRLPRSTETDEYHLNSVRQRLAKGKMVRAAGFEPATPTV
jgi:hypothetical protein